MHRKAHQSYTKEFKEQAVSLVLEQGYKIVEAAERLGLSKSALGKWVQAKKDEERGSGLSFSERKELNQLRKMLKEAQMA